MAFEKHSQIDRKIEQENERKNGRKNESKCDDAENCFDQEKIKSRFTE